MGIFRPASRKRRIERMIRAGTGIREAAWRLDDPRADADLPHAAVEWLRHAMAEMRRPDGIDHVALALAARDEGGIVVTSRGLGILRPTAFYDGEGGAAVAAFVVEARATLEGRGGELVVALLSLGDVAYELAAIRAA